MAGVHAMMISGGGNSSGSGGGATANDCGDITVDALYLKPNGVTIAAIPNAACGKWHTFEGKDYYIAVDYADLVSVVSVYKGLSGSGEVLADLTRDGQKKAIPLNQVVTTFVDKFSSGNLSSGSGLFYNAKTFNQLLASWDVSNVDDMNGIFRNCYVFNQDISNWDTGNVRDMWYMFMGCGMFNQDLIGWCVSKLPTKPSYFDTDTSSTWTRAMKPNWGAAC